MQHACDTFRVQKWCDDFEQIYLFSLGVMFFQFQTMWHSLGNEISCIYIHVSCHAKSSNKEMILEGITHALKRKRLYPNWKGLLSWRKFINLFVFFSKCRSDFIYGCTIAKEVLAFSDPTPDGKRLASTYVGTQEFLVFRWHYMKNRLFNEYSTGSPNPFLMPVYLDIAVCCMNQKNEELENFVSSSY